MRIVIVGGVAGGMSAATRLHRLLEDAEITVYERSGHVSFANCGLPYHVGGVIEERSALLLQTPQSLGARFGLDVRVGHEVVGVDRGDVEQEAEALCEQGQAVVHGEVGGAQLRVLAGTGHRNRSSSSFRPGRVAARESCA